MLLVSISIGRLDMEPIRQGRALTQLTARQSLAIVCGFGILGVAMSFPEKITIQSHTIPIVPRYVETDKGGVIHHSVYPVWFEMGRTELLRANGVAYKDLETKGVFFVVAELRIKYRRPAFYDEHLLLETTCSNVTAAKIEHLYRLTRKSTGLLLAEGSSVLACVSADGTIRRIPEFLFPADTKKEA